VSTDDDDKGTSTWHLSSATIARWLEDHGEFSFLKVVVTGLGLHIQHHSPGPPEDTERGEYYQKLYDEGQAEVPRRTWDDVADIVIPEHMAWNKTIKEIRNARARGYSFDQIAHKHGLDRERVKEILDRGDTELRDEYLTGEKVRGIAGYARRKMAKRTGK
jgi:hypothetical protein